MKDKKRTKKTKKTHTTKRKTNEWLKDKYYEFNKKKRKTAKIYSRTRFIAGLINGIIIPIVALFLLLQYDIINILSDMFQFNFSVWVGLPLFILAITIILQLIELPLSFYFGYIYEHKYKLSNQSIGGWIWDYTKSSIIGFIFAVIIDSVIFALIIYSPTYWWIWAWLFMFGFEFFISFIYPVTLFRLFYKLKPYDNKKMIKSIKALCKKAGVNEVKKILIADESSKSNKPNAMFTGLGSTKRVILFDTLADNFTDNEIKTVIGHELGHYHHKDILYGSIISGISSFVMLFLINLLLGLNLFGITKNMFAVLVLITFFFQLFGLITMPLFNIYSRWRERRADWFALELVKLPKAQISTEKKLADMALGDDKPNRFIEWVWYSHPAIWRRVEMSESWAKQNKKRTTKRKSK